MKAAVLAVLVAAGFVAQVGAANTAVFYVRSLQLDIISRFGFLPPKSHYS